MNYEEKYKEILEWARKNKARLNGVPIEEVLPELNESEDERIRKALVKTFEKKLEIGFEWTEFGIPNRSVLAWLEKQKEQKPADEAEKFFDSVESYNQGFVAGQKKMKEDIEKGFGISEHSLDYLAGRYAGYAAARQEQEPAKWSDEDADMLNCCISSIEEAKENRYAYKETDGDTSYDREIDWLKSLSLNLKKKNEDVAKLCSNEWSKEDEAMIKSILFVLESYVSQSESASSPSLITTYPTYYKEIDWLKSLRPQPQTKTNDYITPHKKFFQWIYNRLVDVHGENPNVDYMQSFKKRIDNLQFDEPQWKPSEEQMDALRASNSYWLGTSNETPRTDLLESLYNDLEKLIAKR